MPLLPFALPLKVVSEFIDGTDAHIIDAAGNVVVAESEWRDIKLERWHKYAMQLICDAVNEKYQPKHTS